MPISFRAAIFRQDELPNHECVRLTDRSESDLPDALLLQRARSEAERAGFFADLDPEEFMTCVEIAIVLPDAL